MALHTSPEQPAPVRQVATLVAGWVNRLGAVWVEGQVAQISRSAGSATVFLTVRDTLADVSVPVTCHRQVVDAADPPLTEGAQVVLHGRPRYYENRGRFSLVADDIRMVGLGELLGRIERRKQLLAAEGLFDRARKRPLPFLPRTVGLITSAGSAAERDVLETTRRRWPAVRFAVVHASMQGRSSAADVIAALQRLDRDPKVDVVVVARGGGSVEDLLPFSDEGLLRAVAAARTPVVSAIGHEPDTPLLDLVADLRAATPTDAARHVVPDMAEELHRVAQLRGRLRRQMRTQVAHETAALRAMRARPCLADPRSGLASRRSEVDALVARGRRTVRHCLDRGDADVASARARVRALSPLATLRRGYAVLQDARGHVVARSADAADGTELVARLAEGRLDLTVTGSHQEESRDE